MPVLYIEHHKIKPLSFSLVCLVFLKCLHDFSFELLIVVACIITVKDAAFLNLNNKYLNSKH